MKNKIIRLEKEQYIKCLKYRIYINKNFVWPRHLIIRQDIENIKIMLLSNYCDFNKLIYARYFLKSINEIYNRNN